MLMPEPSTTSAADSCTIRDFDELLALDDVFVEYFNEFLRLGAFVQKLEYDRQLNTFVERPRASPLNANDESSSVDNDDASVHSDSSDFIQLDTIPETMPRFDPSVQKTRQAQMMAWAKHERLSLFWRTELYRQYKLCKHLVRPLISNKEASDYSSQRIGGYSRQ